MTHPIDPERFQLVVAVDVDGHLQLHSSMCDGHTAETLHRIASWLQTGTGPHQCPPDFDAGDDNLRAAPIHASGGRLDAARKRWTDGTDHTWNLALDWEDYADRVWRWTGRLDQRGAPIMQALDDPRDTEPLDILRSWRGPITPKVGERQ